MTKKSKGRAVAIRKKQPDWAPPRKRVEFHVSPIIQILFGAGILALIYGVFNWQNKPEVIIEYPTPTQVSEIQYEIQTVIVVVTNTPLPPAKKVSADGLKFIKFFEGNSPIAYFDVGEHCTIGVGHRVDPIWCIGELRAKSGDIEKWFNEDIRDAEKYLALRLGMVKLNQCQFDALASFRFNLGDYYFDYSGMIETLQKGNFDGALDVFAKYVYSEGIGPIEGMRVRRAAEAKLFEECVYVY